MNTIAHFTSFFLPRPSSLLWNTPDHSHGTAEEFREAFRHIVSHQSRWRDVVVHEDATLDTSVPLRPPTLHLRRAYQSDYYFSNYL